MHRGELVPASFQCAWCGEKNDIVVEPGRGKEQQLVEDCQICLHPNVLYIKKDPATGNYIIHADKGS